MPTPLVLTKLRPPPPSPARPERPRVTRRIEAGAQGRLTLLSAPPGYGKTTALANWLERTSLDAAWLGLDGGDNAPRRFLRHVIAALQGRDETLRRLGDIVDPAGEADGEDLEAALITIVNDVAANERPLVLVLDDLHVLESERVHALLRFLLEHAPDQLRLVAGTRVDPPLPLARLRVAGRLAEIRADTLRLDDGEADALLRALGVALEPALVSELVVRTEGWPAGVHLAGLSLHGRADPAAFVRYFTGTDRFVLEYLTEEVLLRQPPPVQDFLLRSSVLEAMDAELAREVTGDEDAASMLERLERTNLFLVPLDERHETYRYHAFFDDLLQHRLREARPDLWRDLQRRAAEALRRRGDAGGALRHAWLSGDPALAAELLAAHPHGERVRASLRALLGPTGEEGPADPLVELQQRGLTTVERLRVIEALEDDEDRAGDGPEAAARATVAAAGLEPLSERELEVLRLIAAGASNKAIARRLAITLNTVKTHARNAYAKLDVSSRTEAAARARELGLV